jgi:hypothetical protein
MKKLLLASAALVALSLPASAAIITSFGADPTSTSGAFNHSLGALIGGFDDQYTFTLSQDMTLTIASVTNVFAQNSDFITDFTGSVFAGTPGAPGAQVIGPVSATLGCGLISNCQGFAGAAFLTAGAYFLDISGIANGTSGYGGNLATFASPVPVPAVGAGLPGVIAGFGALYAWGKRRARKKAGGQLYRLAAA